MPNFDRPGGPKQRYDWRRKLRVERRIIAILVMDAIKAGYTIDVFDGEEFPLKGSTNPDTILKHLWTVDDEKLFLNRAGSRGWVRLVHGNDGWDVICDYTTNLEDVMTGANAAAEKASGDA